MSPHPRHSCLFEGYVYCSNCCHGNQQFLIWEEKGFIGVYYYYHHPRMDPIVPCKINLKKFNRFAFLCAHTRFIISEKLSSNQITQLSALSNQKCFV